MNQSGQSQSGTGASAAAPNSPAGGGNSAKAFKKGEILFKEGDRATTLYLIQSGAVSAQLIRAKPIEIFSVPQGAIIGDHALMGVAVHPFSAVATQDVKALELPIEAVKAQLDSLQGVQKICVKSFMDRLKVLQAEVKSSRLERDSSACPPDQLAKVFATLFLIAKIKGQVKDQGAIHINWNLAKQYAQRVLLESPKRLEQVSDLFVKMNQAEWVMQKDPERADDPQAPLEKFELILRNLSLVEDTFEHWQYYFYKGGKADFLKTDEKVMQVVAALVEYSKSVEVDRAGRAYYDYPVFIERYKLEFGVAPHADVFALVEQKGVSVVRKTFEIDGKTQVKLQFEPAELARWSRVWTVLKEVERWNERGFVDLTEPCFDPLRKPTASAIKGGPTTTCPSCQTELEGTPKFCPECGHKLAQAA